MSSEEEEFQEVEDFEVVKIVNDRVLKNGQVSIQAIIRLLFHININLIFEFFRFSFESDGKVISDQTILGRTLKI